MVEQTPIEVRTTSPGIVLDIPVQPGSTVDEDDELVILECMKMEIPIQAPRAGTVREIRVSVGDRLQVDDVLVVLS